MFFNTNQYFLFNISSCKLTVYKIFLLYFAVIEQSEFINGRKLLIVSYDGFRYDYFERNLTPFMTDLKYSGSYADYMINVFITSTFTNHHSIGTGLFAESHGVVDNEYYDRDLKKKFGYSEEMYHYNDNVVPIWTLNEKNGNHTGSMMWPGAEMEYQNTTLTCKQNYDISINWTTRIDTVISWFKHNDTPINLGLLYIEDPDHHSHRYGINNTVFDGVLQKLDDVTQYIHNQLIENGLQDVNVIHLSDHGMTTITYENIIDVRPFLNSTDYTIAGRALALSVFPKSGQIDEIYRKLKASSDGKYDVYLKQNIPVRLNYKDNPRIGPIFLKARPGYAFYPMMDNILNYIEELNVTLSNESEFGVHGYDNQMEEMRPFFFAYGPAFAHKCRIEPFVNVDLYPLICEILQLKCPLNNGTLKQLKKCLTFSVPSDNWLQFDIYLTASCIGLIIFLFLVLFCHHQHLKESKAKQRQNVAV